MWRKTALIALALSAATFAQDKKDAEEEKKKEEEAKAKLADFRKDLKAAKSDKDFVRALEGLGGFQHPKIIAELKIWLGKPSAEVSIAAAEQLGKYKKDKEASEALTGAAGGRKDKEPVIKCLRYTGDVGYKPATSKLLGFFRNKELDVAKEAIDSCGKLKSREAVDPLISLGRELEGVKEDKDNKNGGGGGIGGGGIIGGGAGANGGGVQNEQLARKKALLSPTISALEDILGQKFATIKEAEQWWRANKGTWKEPE